MWQTFFKICVHYISSAQEWLNFTSTSSHIKNLFFPTVRIKNVDVLSPLWTACLHDLSVRGGALLVQLFVLFTFAIIELGEDLHWARFTQKPFLFIQHGALCRALI